MSDTRRTHPGYFRVGLGIALLWYLALGLGLIIFHHTAATSPTTHLVQNYIPLLAWGIVYTALGIVLAVTVLVRRIPHQLARICLAIGLVCTMFWLVCYIVSAGEGKLHLISVIPAWATILAIECAAFIEPQGGPPR